MVVIWGPDAKNDLNGILRYIQKEFGTRNARKFREEIKKLEQQLTNFPYIGKLEPLLTDIYNGNIRSIPVDKLCKLIYTEGKENRLYILALWDTRRAPDTLVNETRRRT